MFIRHFQFAFARLFHVPTKSLWPTFAYRKYSDYYKPRSDRKRNSYQAHRNGLLNYDQQQQRRLPCAFAQPPPNLLLNKAFLKKQFDIADRPDITNWKVENRITILGQEKLPLSLQPIDQFDELENIPADIKESINQLGLTRPTLIQSIAWPIALAGVDLVAISQTGSGKTLGYALPALVHINGNQHRAPYGPSVLVLAPTRELAQQIKAVVDHFSMARSVCIFGGASKDKQRNEIYRIKPSMLIACPGRLIDFVQEGAITLQNISYLVLDEADRMLDMGFEDQIRKIVHNLPKDRQTLMWSATWPQEVIRLAEDFLTDYVQVTVGSTNLAANPNIRQIVHVCNEQDKLGKLYEILNGLKTNNISGKTLIFAETKRKVNFLTRQLQSHGWLADSIHGDKTQMQRDNVLNAFRLNRLNILVATDVAARGLDVRDINVVINYDYPNDSESYVHRIGRTGRHGATGIAHTFITDQTGHKQVRQLIDVLREAEQYVSTELYSLASHSRPTHRSNNPRHRR